MPAIEGVSSSLVTAINDLISSASANASTTTVNLLDDEGGSFSDIFTQAFNDANTTNSVSNDGTLDLLSGEVEDMAGILVDATKAELALNLTVSLRNKMLEAYQEITSMQI